MKRRWLIKGYDRLTGEDRQIIVVAVTNKAARTAACKHLSRPQVIRELSKDEAET